MRYIFTYNYAVCPQELKSS